MTWLYLCYWLVIGAVWLALICAGLALLWGIYRGGRWLIRRVRAWRAIDTGDYVLHRPTGEQWIVAYVRGDRLAWCGWPEGEAKLADCKLLKKASPEKRDYWLRQMAESPGDGPRQRHGRAVLAKAQQITGRKS